MERKTAVKRDGRTVMVVDDFDATRAKLKRVLEKQGHHVVEAVDGWEAVGLANSLRPDLILMDLYLPVLDGAEAASLLREHGDFDDVPMVALTAHDSADARADAADAGFDEYVTKPINFEQLQPLIDRFLNVVVEPEREIGDGD